MPDEQPMQRSLWGEGGEGDTITFGIGDLVELGFSWANGDTSQDALEQLARVLKGDLEIRRDTTGRERWFRILDTHVRGERVMGICQAIEPLVKGTAAWDTRDDDIE